jgi:uncharacterized protein (TIGR03086 family)
MSTEHLANAFASTRAVLERVTPDQLARQTPCRSWDVAGLINHMIAAPRYSATALSSGTGVAEEADYAAGDYLAAYDESRQRALEAFGAHGAMDTMVTMPFGEIPGSALVMIIAADQFTHGWDLAKATGQSTDLDRDLANTFLEFARGMLRPELRGDDGVMPFGPECAAPPGASPADQLAAFEGRTV